MNGDGFISHSDREKFFKQRVLNLVLTVLRELVEIANSSSISFETTSNQQFAKLIFDDEFNHSTTNLTPDLAKRIHSLWTDAHIEQVLKESGKIKDFSESI